MHTQLFLRILKSVVALFAAGWVSFTLTAFGQVPVVSPAAQAAHATITSYDGPATCIACHATQAQQMFGSVHYQEMGETPNVPNINGPAGKGLNGGKVMNSYCGTPTTSSRATCATCHVGNGRIPSTQLTTQQLTNIDCMMCHQDAYKRVPAPPMQTITFQGTNGPHSIQAPIEDETGFQYMPDAAKMTIPILDAARTVHLPTRASCLRCHAGAGGSDGGKRGDLSTVTVNPPATSDIHMSPQAADLSCANCHSAGGHRVAGRGVDLRPNDSTNRLACANCHTDRPHGDYSATTSSSRDLHAGHVACQTCHIPKFAKDKSTEMQRTWLAAGFSMAACRGQGGWVPHEVRATNVVPTYRWFDGTSLANVLDQVPPENAAGEYVLAWPNGSVQSAASKLYPMKVHRSDSAVQDASGLLIPHSTFAFFTSGDFTKAVQDGQAQSGLTGAASVVPVLEYQTINHGVESRTNALQCGACHSSLSPGGPARMNLQADLGYALKGTMTQVCSQCHGSKSNPGFASVHSRHVTNYRYDCSSCHNFSRPERGLTRISAIRPAAPSGPVATTVSASRIDLVWADNSTTEQGFKIERSTDGVSFTQISTVSANITVASDTGLTAGRPYYYRVRAYNTTGDSDYSMIGRANTAAGTTPTLPAAPSGLAATAASASQVNLTWTDNANNETGFAVERAVGTGSFVQIATLGANITSYADTALSANTTFSYRVRAYNSAGNSAYSATATATTPNVPPAAPSGLTATAASASQINLAWTDNANNETGFALERSSDNVTFTQIATVGANVTSYANTGLSASTTYYYRVRASNAAGNSAYSATASATTAAILTPPAAPSGLTATAASSSQINLAWTDNANNETGFAIERSTDNVTFTSIASVGANVTAYANTGLSASTTYYYRVRASNAAGNSAYSATASATTAAIQTPPAAPSGLTASAASASQINLAWTDNANNETGFALERSTDNATFTQIATVGANVTSYANTGLSASTTYYYRVRASNAAGNSAYSATASATTAAIQTAPAAPSGLTATAASAGQINLAWTDNANNETGFALERSTDNATFTQIATVGANVTSYANTGLSTSTTYYYRVRASNAAGNSAYSATASATTTGSTTPGRLVLASIGSEDGYVLESTESSNVGGSAVSSSSSADSLRAGDERGDRQYRTILSFDTSAIPDGATIVSATLRLKCGRISGSNPFEFLGACRVDIKSGNGFNNSPALTKEDFQAPADATAVAALSNAEDENDWSIATLDARGLALVNKAGKTQFRVAFQRDDNNDEERDFIGWYSGEASSSNRPQLEISFR